MTFVGCSTHPVKEIENTKTKNVVNDICRFDNMRPLSSLLFILTSDALSKGKSRFSRSSLDFGLFCWFCNEKPARRKSQASCARHRQLGLGLDVLAVRTKSR